MRESVDRLGRRVTLNYDVIDRLTSVVYQDATVSYAYDAASRPTRIDDTQSGAVAWSYDDADRVLSETTPAGIVQYAYNAASELTSMTAADRAPVNYGYDTAGRLQSLAQGSETFTYSYDVLSRLSSLQRPNGITTSYSYDTVNRLSRMLHRNAASQAIEDFQYSYNVDDEIASITALASASVLPQAKTASAADAANRLGQFGNVNYSFDNLGQTTAKTDSQGTTSYNWDARGKLTSVSLPNGQSVSYGYDALGRRASRTTNGATTSFLYDGTEVVLDRKSDGATVDYLNGAGIDNKLRQTSSSVAANPHYFLQDHLGSTTALTDASGGVIERQSYEAFGATTGSSNTRYGYTGRELDSTTGLMYYRARWYDPQQSRFITEDPSGFEASLNFYVYVEDNPMNSVDPEGLDRVWVCWRPLNRGWPVNRFRHTYIQIETDQDNGTPRTDTWGILGEHGKKNSPQVPYKNEGAVPGDPRNSTANGGKCIPVPGYVTQCQIDALRKALDAAEKAKDCPSCGANYRGFFIRPFKRPLIDGYNSNTFVYNMLEGVGMTPPPISKAPGYHKAPGKWY